MADSINRNPHPDFKKVEASRPQWEVDQGFHYTKTADTNWKFGQGRNDLPDEGAGRSHVAIDPHAEGDKTEVDLIFANVTPQDILLKEDLDALAAEDKGIRVHYVLDNPPEGWTGGVGYVTADMITKFFPKPADDVKILLCGPPPMISGLKKATESLGFKKARPVSKLEDQVFAF
ncbi:hypothetical protein NLG97_g10057 [Lecanicillium saksenae]|uniref:Uncharacterized protein n=1 Tax=Lecanicillium saksenae TaxID=468837 RepID=A0ACC1QGZ6_9HYPO|nr:hypothetical protein NLG97_g10057 [Lecanicillium saksenae]